MTRATRVKNLLARPKHIENQTRQLTATPPQAACKTNTRSRSKEQKTHGRQNAAKARAARSADTDAPRGTVRGKPAYATGAFLALAPALVRRRPRRTARRAKRPSPQPSRRRRGTTLLNSLREAAHVKKPPRTKNNCSSTCWSGGDGLGSPAMITNEARAARTHLPRDGAVGSWAPSAALGRGIYRRARCDGRSDVVESVASIAWRAPRSLQNVSRRWSAGPVVPCASVLEVPV